MVQLTGSTRTGRAIAARAGERLIPCGVELGGKDPAIVLADADLSRAANGIAWGALFNSGQACISVERVYVEAPAYDRFVALLTERVRSIRQGVDNGSYSVDVGALVTKQQVEIVSSHVRQRGRSRGHDRDRRKDDGQRRVLRAHDSSRRGSFDGLHERRDFRPDDPGDEGRRRTRGDPVGKRLPIWAVGNGVDEGYRSRTRHPQLLEVGAVNVNDAYSNLFCFPLPQGGWKISGLGYRLGRPAGYPGSTAVSRPSPRHACGGWRTNCCGIRTRVGEAASLPRCCACSWPAMSGGDYGGPVAETTVMRRLSPGRSRGRASVATLRAGASPPRCRGPVCRPRLPASN